MGWILTPHSGVKQARGGTSLPKVVTGGFCLNFHLQWWYVYGYGLPRIRLIVVKSREDDLNDILRYFSEINAQFLFRI
jgi:hypothetical protein